MAEGKSVSTVMRPRFEEVQAHYDLSDDFFGARMFDKFMLFSKTAYGPTLGQTC